MKLVAILGSPHGIKGTTGQMLEALVAGAKENGAEVETFVLARMEVQPCRACDVCHKTGECAIEDDFGRIKRAMLAAEGIVLASPNYIFSVTAQMKALLDRTCGPLHLQAFEGKYGAVVVSSGGDGSEEVERYMIRFLRSHNLWTAGSIGAAAWELGDPARRAQILQGAAKLGTRLVQAIANKETFADQMAERRAFHERMKQLVAMRKADWPYEYEYWQARGRP